MMEMNEANRTDNCIDFDILFPFWIILQTLTADSVRENFYLPDTMVKQLLIFYSAYRDRYPDEQDKGIIIDLILRKNKFLVKPI